MKVITFTTFKGGQTIWKKNKEEFIQKGKEIKKELDLDKTNLEK